MKTKFRGFSERLNKWVYGDLVDGNVIVNGIVELNNDDIVIERWEQVVPESVGQYIGVDDSTGAEIYNGDVIGDEHGRYNLVRFSKGLYFIGNWNAHGFINAFQTYAVIGNIHENNELLEGE